VHQQPAPDPGDRAPALRQSLWLADMARNWAAGPAPTAKYQFKMGRRLSN